MSKIMDYRVELYAAGRRALASIKKRAHVNFDDWMKLGEVFREIQTEAAAVVGNRLDTLAGRREIGDILRREKLHDEQDGPDKTTRALLLRLIEREPEVRAWYKALPQDKKLAWNHPTSIWRHFDKKEPAAPKASKTTGLSPAEEAEQVENAQIHALQKRDEKITSLRDTVREHNLTAGRQNAEIVSLRRIIADLLRHLGAEVSDIPTNEEIVAAWPGGRADQ